MLEVYADGKTNSITQNLIDIFANPNSVVMKKIGEIINKDSEFKEKMDQI